ncbi:SDR family NAD(P)-dependent oxidoreductase [Candidatus Xenohaliotis californiensis]|uniref:SDR family NAD(P)-dependent oxidoreductase n=1 Tax=Candidatus Xenohaliotis californiensis TaxID=84677 RepID=A0ABP0EW24_9RICK|nr:SDR family NAD(P)-dependent oxidoreductase [Candidatus Xenohaliotis californiensis]
MVKNILITGSTDGIGLETAKKLLKQGHYVLLHGRNSRKLENVVAELSALGKVESYVADLSDMNMVRKLAKEVSDHHKKLDVLINNAGVLKAPNIVTKDGLDIRFAVNTIAPYLLTKLLLPLLDSKCRVVNLSSAAQASVDLDILTAKNNKLNAMDTYSQSKLAITMWSFAMADSLGSDGPIIITVNPGSLLASKMVHEGFGIVGNDISIGADILVRVAIFDEFSDASGKYFDNDSKQFTNPHSDALNSQKCNAIITQIESFLSKL